MALSLTSADDLDDKVSKSCQIWPAAADRSKVSPLVGTFVKDEHTGEIIVGYEDPDELGGLELVIRLDDGSNSEYTGTFNADGLFVKS